MELKTYTLKELEVYLPPLFSSPETTIPLSPLRLSSYLNNPRADKGDTVLFEMFHKNQLVGYRTLLPDLFFNHDGVPQRFAWLSGNWVHPDMRRKGISTELLVKAEEIWAGRLMYTNYAPDSKALYDHTGHFKEFARRDGKRFYLRSNAEELLGKRMGAGGLLRMGDQLLNQFREQNLKSYRVPEYRSIKEEDLREIPADLKALITLKQQNSLFRRDGDIFSWALDFPWVSHGNVIPLNYHFSYGAENFENRLFAYNHSESGARGLLWLIRHNRTLTAPYLFTDDDELLGPMAASLIRNMIRLGCSQTTIRHRGLLSRMDDHRKLFLHSKPMPQFIFAHQKLAADLPEGSVINDGDGDVMFTG